MTVWVVKGGRVGEMEEFALQQGVAVIDFGLERSVTDFADRAALHDQVPASAANQLWRFAHEMREGDIPRSNFDQDLLFSMGAAQTVSQPTGLVTPKTAHSTATWMSKSKTGLSGKFNGSSQGTSWNILWRAF